MWNTESAAVAAAHSVDPDRWRAAFGEVVDRIAPLFARYEPLRHAAGLMQGLVAGLDARLGPEVDLPEVGEGERTEPGLRVDAAWAMHDVVLIQTRNNRFSATHLFPNRNWFCPYRDAIR